MLKNELKLTKRERELIKKRKLSSRSKGELAIMKFLGENGIEFIDEFYFKEMRRLGKLKLLFFDFYIPSYRLAIEFDGIQHYTKEFKGKKMPHSEENDFMKNAFCKKNKIELLRIKYDQIDNVETIIFEKFDKISPNV